MGSTGKIYAAIGFLLLILLIFLEYTKPKEISWFPSYDKKHTIPYGMKILHEEMNVIFQDRFQDVSKPPYSYLNNQDDLKGTYFFVNKNIVFGKEEMNAILNWVAKGNQLFVASSSFEENLLDTLGLETDVLVDYGTLKSSYLLSLKNKAFKNRKEASFDRNTSLNYFTINDTLPKKTSAIGEIKISGKTKQYVNVIQQPFGKGQVILSLFPEAFTNYFILKVPNEGYVEGLLSYFSKSDRVFFDNYYKTGSKYYGSPMYVFLNNKALKWAYYFILLAALFYILFEGKRKQRNIPVLTPLKNQTLNFVRTIANMYYEKNDHRDIARYKINHFLAYLRSQQPIGNTEIDSEQIKAIAARNGKKPDDTETLFKYISSIRQKQTISKEELITLNRMIENFKK